MQRNHRTDNVPLELTKAGQKHKHLREIHDPKEALERKFKKSPINHDYLS